MDASVLHIQFGLYFGRAGDSIGIRQECPSDGGRREGRREGREGGREFGQMGNRWNLGQLINGFVYWLVSGTFLINRFLSGLLVHTPSLQ